MTPHGALQTLPQSTGSVLDSKKLSSEESFLQSLEWEEIQKRYGRETRRILVGTSPMLCIKNDLRFGLSYWYSPRPFITDLTKFVESAGALIKDGLFFKLEPINESRIRNQELSLIQDSRFKIHESKNLQPRETILMDLSKSEEELLTAMHPKTRYNTRVAERHGVKIEARSGKEALDDFSKLLLKTADRDQFSLHSWDYYKCLLFSNSQEFENRLFFAMHNGEIAAVAMINFYRGTATYLHGASNYTLRQVMAPYALHWQIMKEAKARGFYIYDFGGIDEARWPGVTRFKRGFGGAPKAFPEALDVVSRPLRYAIYKTGAYLTGFIR